MLDSLHGRPRTRRLARVLDAATDGRIAAAPPPPPPPPTPAPPTPPAPLPLLERPPVAPYGGGPRATVTEALWARVPAGTEEAVAGHLAGPIVDLWEAVTPPVERHRMALPLALHFGLPGVEEATGLRVAMPPGEVHAMAHGPLATGGPLQYGDVIAGALAEAGAPLAPGQSVLDFGCSSGRVIRVLHAYDPELDCLGCDPNGPAIAWAAEHLPGIRFFESPTVPPLDLPSGSLDVAFAISIWSHFDEVAARGWLDEMARVIRPGGHLLLTTQGWQSVAYFARLEGNDVEHQRPLAHALYTDGFAFVDVFGEDGDWGVSAERWGMGFLTAEWLAEAATPAWSIALGRSGAIEGNQDMYVLQRR